LKVNWRVYISLFSIAAVVICLDQYSKFLIRKNLAVGEIWSPWDWMTPYARIVNWYNTGVAFGMFQGLGQVFTILNIVVSILIIFYYERLAHQGWLIRLAMGMLLGGAIGNLVDRMIFGHVTDFISIGTFPVFNVADSSISIGVAMILLTLWLQERRKNTPAPGDLPSNTPVNPPAENESTQ